MTTKDTKLTQLERAKQCFGISKINYQPWEALDEVVGEAQNRPPEGAADGSINENVWYYLRDIVKACQDLEYALTGLDEFLKEQK